MTTTFENAIKEVSGAMDSAYESGTTNAGTIARLATGLLQMLGNANGDSVTIGDVSISADTLARYVRKTLPNNADAKPMEGLPTASQLIGAIAATSDKIVAAEKRLADHVAKAKKADVIGAAEHNAQAERIRQSLNTAKQPIRRALMMSAYVATAKDDDGMRYDIAATEVRNGVLWAHYATPRGDVEASPISFDYAKERVSPASERAPNGATQQNAKQPRVQGVVDDGHGNLASVVIGPEMVRRGGVRAQLGDALLAVAGLLSDLDGEPNAIERAALARLYVAVERKLDADAFALVADIRDQQDEAAG